MRGAILAGGGATRYGGRPKGCSRSAAAASSTAWWTRRRAVGSPPLLVANAPDAATGAPGLHVVPDVRPGAGALGGIYTAVGRGPGAGGLRRLGHAVRRRGAAPRLADGLEQGFDAFLPQSDGRRGVEPLCAAYGPACHAAIAAALDEGDLRAIAFHDARQSRYPPRSTG